MRYIHRIILASFITAAILSFQSCTTITEELSIKENGSGEYVFYMDLIPMMKRMTFEMEKMFQDKDSTAVPETDEERMARIDTEIWKDFPAQLDSTFIVGDELPDSLKSDPLIKKYLANTVGFLEGGQDKGYLHSGFKFKFKELSELTFFMDFMQELNNNNPETQDASPYFKDAYPEVEYRLSGMVFSKKVIQGPKMEDNTQDEDNLKSIFAGNLHRQIIHLPYPIKKVEGLEPISIEGNTVVFESSLGAVFSGELKEDFTIYMKK